MPRQTHAEFLDAIDDIFREFYHMLERYKADLKDYVIDYAAPTVNANLLEEITSGISQFESLQNGIVTSQVCDDQAVEDFIAKFHRLSYLYQNASQIMHTERSLDYPTVATYIRQMLKDAQDAMKIHLRKLDFDNLFETFGQNQQQTERPPGEKTGGFVSNPTYDSAQKPNQPSRQQDSLRFAAPRPQETVKKGGRPSVESSYSMKETNGGRFEQPQQYRKGHPGDFDQNMGNVQTSEARAIVKQEMQPTWSVNDYNLELHARINTKLSDTAQALAYIDQSEHLAIGGFDDGEKSPLTYKISIWDLKTFRQTISIPSHFKTIKQLLFVPERQYLISCSSDRNVKVWNCHRNYSFEKTLNHEDEVEAIEYIAADNVILSCGKFKDIHCYDVNNGYNRTWLNSGGVTWFTAVKYIPTRDLVILACASKGQLWVYDWPTKSLIQKVEGHKRGFAINAITYLSLNNWIVTGRAGGALQIWSLDANDKVTFMRGTDKLGEGVSGLLPILDQEVLVSTNYDRSLRFWNTNDCSLNNELPLLDYDSMLQALLFVSAQNMLISSDARRGTLILIKFHRNM